MEIRIIVKGLETFEKIYLTRLGPSAKSQKTRASKIMLSHSISKQKKLLNVKDPLEVRKGDPPRLGKGTRLWEVTP